jgi:predicted secreted protein
MRCETMERNRKVILLSHCILNCNSKVEGCSVYKGAMGEIIKAIVDSGIGILQLPCPELTAYGVKRWGHVKDQFDTPYYRRHCRNLFVPYLEQLQDYINNGYKIVGLLGIDGSPSCGINKTCTGKWGGEFSGNPDMASILKAVEMAAARGVFIEELESLLMSNNISMPFMGIDEASMADSIININNFIGGL